LTPPAASHNDDGEDNDDDDDEEDDTIIVMVVTPIITIVAFITCLSVVPRSRQIATTSPLLLCYLFDWYIVVE
jgi:hypothetical protein